MTEPFTSALWSDLSASILKKFIAAESYYEY